LPNIDAAKIHEVIKSFAKSNDEDPRSWSRYLDRERLAFFHEILAKYREVSNGTIHNSIADAGCGSGYLLRILANTVPHAKLVGYDTYDKGLTLAKSLSPTAEFFNKSIEEIDEKYDVIFCTEVLEHLLNPQEALQYLLDNITTGGGLFLTVPNGRYDHQEAGNLREDGTAYWGHVHFWSPESWSLFLNDHLSQVSNIVSGTIGGDKLYAWVSK